MKETWNFDLIDLLSDAQNGNVDPLHAFIKQFSPLAAVNETNTTLIVLRPFKVSFFRDERKVLNCAPDSGSVQQGITITRSSEGISQTSIYLPNRYAYKALTLTGNDVELITSTTVIKTNIDELLESLKFWGPFTESDVEAAFDTLHNRAPMRKTKPVVASSEVMLPTIGKLHYNEQLNWFEGNFSDESISFAVQVCVVEPDELEKHVAHADSLLARKFYKNVLPQTEAALVNLKNDFWLEADGSEEDETPITAEEFRKRISISTIVFNEDASVTIYCDDDGIFFGHSIEIQVNKAGEYESVALAG